MSFSQKLHCVNVSHKLSYNRGGRLCMVCECDVLSVLCFLFVRDGLALQVDTESDLQKGEKG